MSEKKSEPSVTTFLLVRHAESEANAGAYFGSQQDVKLNEKGRRQVEVLTRTLAGTPLSAIYSSDLSRAIDTVTPLAQLHGISITKTPRLRERAMGILTGLSFEEVRTQYPELWRDLVERTPQAAPPGGESHDTLFQRVSSFLKELTEKHHGETLLISSHGVAINHMLRHLLGLQDHSKDLWFTIENTSVSRVEIHHYHNKKDASRILYINRVGA